MTTTYNHAMAPRGNARTVPAWVPADSREAPVPTWTPAAPWSSRSVEPRQDVTSYTVGPWGPAFIILFQLLMVWLLLTA